MDSAELNQNLEELTRQLTAHNMPYKLNEQLAPYTTFKIGGPTDIFVEAKSKEQLIDVIKLAKISNVPYTIIGWGSNVLVSDKGIRGLVVRNNANNIKILDANNKETEQNGQLLNDNSHEVAKEARLDQLEPEKYYSFSDLDYDESTSSKIKVEIESGSGLPITIARLIKNGITGLQWFGGIPGTVGGAVYNNIHGGSHFLAEYINKVVILDPATNELKTYSKAECEFGYDFSRFHKSKEVILSVVLDLYEGDADKAKYVFQEWTRRKAIQPQKSAGCVWQNLSEKEKENLKLESTSWGYIIDKILGLKGKQIGGAQISEKHAAFIENIGNAKASDVLELMELIKKTSLEKLGIEPKSEIFLLGKY